MVVSASFTLVILFLVPASYQQDYDDSLCATPRNEIGTCIGIRQCSFLYNLLSDRNNPRAAQYIQRSTCGFEGRLPKVCCPNKSLNNPPPTTTTTRRLSNNQPTQRPFNTRNGLFSNLPSAANDECGKPAHNSSRRIVGGTPSERGQWPWMVGIGFRIRGRRSNNNPPEWRCGGAIVTARYVVSAAHCISRDVTKELEPYIVHVGDIDLFNGRFGESIEIEKAIMHEKYSSQSRLDDIGLFRLKRDIKLSDFVKPICLPFEGNMRSESFAKRTPFVAGWGQTTFNGLFSTNSLKHVQINVVDNPTCQKIFGGFGNTIDENILCAGVLTGGKDSCGGDSGGPLMLPFGQKYYLIGVVSYGHKCAEPGYPGVYTRVTKYVQWISDNIV